MNNLYFPLLIAILYLSIACVEEKSSRQIFKISNTNHQDILINEVLVLNTHTNLTPDKDKFASWLEIRNQGNFTIDLGGSILTSKYHKIEGMLGTVEKFWKIPKDTIIAPKSFKIFWGDNNEILLSDHLGFRINSLTKKITLSLKDGTLIDTIKIPRKSFKDVSYGRSIEDYNKFVHFINPTPAKRNSTTPITKITTSPTPTFSRKGGFYKQSITLKLNVNKSNHKIFFTKDGSIPTINSNLYYEKIKIDKNTVIRARTINPNEIPSEITTHSYFINENVTLPVLSIATNPKYLYGDSEGIITNYKKRGERPASVEFFESTSSKHPDFKQNLSLRLQGSYSRNFAQKSLGIRARAKYGASRIKYKVFKDRPNVPSYEALFLKNGGGDWTKTIMREGVIHSFSHNRLDLDYQSHRPVLVFLNGDYYGILSLMEKVDEQYLKNHHGINPKNVDIIHEYNAITKHFQIYKGDIVAYEKLHNFIRTSDPAVPSVYKKIKDQININAHIDYHIVETYINNGDWIRNNIRPWKEKRPNTKWRYILFDLDTTTGLKHKIYHDKLRHTSYDGNRLKFLTEFMWGLNFIDLIKNKEYFNEFAQRFAMHLNTTFSPSRVLRHIDILKNKLSKEIPRHAKKWGGSKDPGNYYHDSFKSYNEWEQNVEVIKEFANKRPKYVREHIIQLFKLKGMKDLNLNIINNSSGNILINNVQLLKNSFVGKFFMNIPINLVALPKKGKKFKQWIDLETKKIISTNNSISLEFKKDRRIQAVFY